MSDKAPLLEKLIDAKSRRSVLKSIGAASAVSLAGCSGGDGEGDGSDGGSPTEESDDSDGGGGGGTATETDSPTPASDQGGQSEKRVFRLNVTQRFGTIDPAKGTDYTQTMANVNLYDMLVFPKADGTLRPHLAKDWTVSDDKKAYTFKLREDATFHSGNPVRAEDVKFTLERLLDINQGWASQFADLVKPKNVIAEDEKTVTFNLEKVFAPFLATLVLLFIVDKKEIMANKKDGEFGDRGDYGQAYLNSHDAGGGAYSLKDFSPGSSLTWKKFDDYWMEFPDNSFDEVVAEIITKDPTVRTLMKQQKLDFTSPYHSQETFQAIKKMNNAEVLKEPSATMFYFKINTQRPPTDDIEVRKAMAWGFQYETVRKQIMPGRKKAVGPIPKLWSAHNSDIVQPTYKPDKAKQILKDAGYSSGEIKVEMAYVKDFGPEEKMGLLFQSNMDKIGIDVSLKPQTWGTMTEQMTDPQKTKHINQVFFGPIKPDLDSYFFNQWYSGAAESWMSAEHLENDEVDRLVEQGRTTVDPEKRQQIYSQLQEKLANLYPDLFVFNDIAQYGIQKDVEGYVSRPAQSYGFWWHDYRRTG